MTTTCCAHFNLLELGTFRQLIYDKLCDADSDSNGEIATNLFINVASKIDFEMCIIPHGTGDYKIKAESTKDSCVIEWNNVDQKSVRTGCD